MVLSVNPSYLSKPGGKSSAAGHFHLSNSNKEDFNNGAILTLSTIIKHVMSLASKAKLVASLPLQIEPHLRNLVNSNQLPLPSPPTTSLLKA
jgi:hypothetical protein